MLMNTNGSHKEFLIGVIMRFMVIKPLLQSAVETEKRVYTCKNSLQLLGYIFSFIIYVIYETIP